MSEKQKRENPSFLFFFAIKARYHFAVTTVVQYPKQISAPAIVEGTPRTIVVLLLCVSVQLLVLATALCKNFPQMFSCVRRSDRRRCDAMSHMYYSSKRGLLANYRILMSRQFFTDLCDTDA